MHALCFRNITTFQIKKKLNVVCKELLKTVCDLTV